MNQQIIAFSIPFFFLLIGIELLVARARKQRLYRFADSVTDLSCGITQQVSLLFLKGALLAGYVFVYETWRVSDIDGVAAWLLAFVGVDFLYYWWHRLSHRVNLLWAAHIVHHQSEDYNLAVALRQSLLTSATGFPFYLMLAFAGVEPIVYATAHAVNTVYQFWIHTELVGKLGPVEWVLNTPSHHRVHHGVNPQYIDRNHAGMLIIWDRLFGTFEEEDEPVVYGIVKPLRSWNPIWANFHHFVQVAGDSWSAPRLRDKLLVWFKGPEWRPPGLTPYPAPQPVTRAEIVKYETPASAGLRWYVGAHFVAVAALTTLLIFQRNTLPQLHMLVGAAVVFTTVVGWGALFERKAWATPFEAARWLLVAGAVVGLS